MNILGLFPEPPGTPIERSSKYRHLCITDSCFRGLREVGVNIDPILEEGKDQIVACNAAIISGNREEVQRLYQHYQSIAEKLLGSNEKEKALRAYAHALYHLLLGALAGITGLSESELLQNGFKARIRSALG